MIKASPMTNSPSAMSWNVTLPLSSLSLTGKNGRPEQGAHRFVQRAALLTRTVDVEHGAAQEKRAEEREAEDVIEVQVAEQHAYPEWT